MFSLDLFFSQYACCAGISGVIFGLIVVDTFLSPNKFYKIFILSIPSSIYPWALLIFIQLLIPNASLIGHASGIIVGYIYCLGASSFAFLPTSLISKIENAKFMSKIVENQSYIQAPSTTIPLFISTSTSSWTKYIPFYGGEKAANKTGSSPSSPIPSFSSPYAAFPGKGQVLGQKSNNEEERRMDNIHYLISKGYTYEQADQALRKSNNDLKLASELLSE